ncbi:TonB-dependent receptor [Bacteroides graminisolvens]|uniref:TonB-dependent receptor n=1 Tax=Bacteroides graminisolvens TaxID=477666 RepID=UPI0023F39C17|nr:TonB-dependent receptor [Bacteroides graminisolvens]
MRRHLIHFLLVALLSVCSAATAIAQTTVKGQVVDAENGDPMIGAAVTVVGTTQGTVTDVDGQFTLNVAPNSTLAVKFLGYKEFKKKVTQRGQVNLGVINLEVDAVALADVTITSSIAVARKTPVAVSTIEPVFIQERLGTQEFPEILKSTPGVYATKQGGGYGDSKINMRGFKSENIAMMINGVPMNDMEWGGVYWSNWAGLSDVTRSMQTQRGLGAAKVAAPSVGGSINIVTNTIEAKKGGSVSYGMGNDGYNKMLFTVSSGLSKSGWAFTLLGGKTWGDGYIQGTEFEGYNWFVNITKRFNESHQLSLTAFGAPQWHNQRNNNDGLTIAGWQSVAKNYMNGDDPYRYNPSYGFGPNGERKKSAYNVYNKPQISLNHLWQINSKSSLSTALYTSIGRGYGYSGQGLTSTDRNNWYGSSYGTLNTTFRNSDGTFAYDQIYDLNEASSNGSLMVMSKSKNFHNWYGLLSTYTNKLTDNIDFYGGVDLRYYKGVHTNEIVDLYGGKYYVDSSSRSGVSATNNSAAAAGSSFVNQKLKVGDVVYRDYDGFVMSEGAFGQVEYNQDKLSAFVAGSLSNTSYWRRDRFYYDADHEKSETVNFIGWTAKGGLNYNLTENHNVFANVGYISRAPFFSGGAFLQATTSNITNPDAVNEKIFSLELGYGFRSEFLTANINAYHTEWKDKTMSKGIDVKDGDTFVDRLSLNMSGVNATHEGIELDFVAKPVTWLNIKGMFSIGDWRWTSNAKGYFYDSTGQPVKSYGKNADTGKVEVVHASGLQTADHASMKINLKDVRVGGSAQTTAFLGTDFRVNKDIRLGIDYSFQGRNYADWAFSSSDILLNGEKSYASPWRIPSAHLFDLNGSYRFRLGSVNATLVGNINNVFNQEYISDAIDGGDHNDRTAYGIFYGFGRTYSVNLKLNF